MDIRRRTQVMLLLENLLVLVILAILIRESESVILLLAFTVGQVFLDSVYAHYILFPLVIYDSSIESLMNALDNEGDEDGALLRFYSTTVDGMDRVGQIIDYYVASGKKQESSRIYDKQTQLMALQSQINPHFLYNTLDSIRGQAVLDGDEEIASMVESLASFFRYSISGKGSLVTLRDELRNIGNYMRIQNYRFNNRFTTETLIEEKDEVAYDYLIPRLIIQPVVENAIFHGLEEKESDGRLTIEIILTDQNLIITISDNGKGIGTKELERLNDRIHSADAQNRLEGLENRRNTGIALPNIHKRIQLLFGKEYGVNVYSTLGVGTDVEITLPINEGTSEDSLPSNSL